MLSPLRHILVCVLIILIFHCTTTVRLSIEGQGDSYVLVLNHVYFAVEAAPRAVVLVVLYIGQGPEVVLVCACFMFS